MMSWSSFNSAVEFSFDFDRSNLGVATDTGSSMVCESYYIDAIRYFVIDLSPSEPSEAGLSLMLNVYGGNTLVLAGCLSSADSL